VYKVELEAHNVSPEQRSMIFDALDKAFTVIIESKLTGEDQWMSLGETKVSEEYPLKETSQCTSTDADFITTPAAYEEIRGLV